jgi:hypothetical protein
MRCTCKMRLCLASDSESSQQSVNTFVQAPKCGFFYGSWVKHPVHHLSLLNLVPPIFLAKRYAEAELQRAV